MGTTIAERVRQAMGFGEYVLRVESIIQEKSMVVKLIMVDGSELYLGGKTNKNVTTIHGSVTESE